MPKIEPTSLSEIQSSSFDLPAYRQSVIHFLQDGQYRNLSPRTLAFYGYHLLGFQRFLQAKDEPLTAASFTLSVQEMVKEMKDQKRAQDTIAGRVRSCRRFFRFLYPDQKCIFQVAVIFVYTFFEAIKLSALFCMYENAIILQVFYDNKPAGYPSLPAFDRFQFYWIEDTFIFPKLIFNR